MADNQRKIERLLDDFAAHGFEKPSGGLLGRIKDRIPARLIAHRLDTMHIIVDFQVNRLTAAAAIIFVVIVIGTLFGGRGVVTDGASFIKYALGGEEAGREEIVEGLVVDFRKFFEAQGRRVVSYENSNAAKGPNTILMFWSQDPDAGTFGVIFGDLSTRTVSTETLTELLGAKVVMDSPKEGLNPADGSDGGDQ